MLQIERPPIKYLESHHVQMHRMRIRCGVHEDPDLDRAENVLRQVCRDQCKLVQRRLQILNQSPPPAPPGQEDYQASFRKIRVARELWPNSAMANAYFLMSIAASRVG